MLDLSIANCKRLPEGLGHMVFCLTEVNGTKEIYSCIVRHLFLGVFGCFGATTKKANEDWCVLVNGPFMYELYTVYIIYTCHYVCLYACIFMCIYIYICLQYV